MTAEKDILQNLFEKWVSLAQEYVGDAPDIRAVYVYASSERGMTVVNAYFDQGGTVVHPGRVEGIETDTRRVGQMQDLLTEDLFDAEDALAAAGVPRPTEYRVYFVPSTKMLDVELAREEQYAGADDRSPIRGIEYWLGDRAPKLI
ncbi:hypothetical protein [uncultured Microbacterium sp.]|uniref:hypothetical protein n=1 Tax=uncultured Microbacterium sp. TaxID=191216 RepID=UPI0025DBFB9C|nr:hypothetical protein [uncultured Microbacterium sp.]